MPEAVTPKGITAVAVPAIVKEPQVTTIRVGRAPSVEIPPFEVPVPTSPGPRPRMAISPTGAAPDPAVAAKAAVAPAARVTGHAKDTPDLITSFDAQDFVDNADNTGGYLFIPPDPHAAAGPNHVASAVNVTLRFFQKDGTQTFNSSFRNFFSALSPTTFTYDPKVLYDQYADRWVIVDLEQTDVGAGDPADTSRIFLAVSDDSDPNGTWYMTAINAITNIGGADRWADYPGFGVDEEAIYVACNMFGFSSSPGNVGVRLWIVDKGLGSGGWYDGGTAAVNKLDPYAAAGIATTTMPAHVYGTAPAGTGTMLVSFSGIHDSDTGDEYVQVVRIDDPLGSPALVQQYVLSGDIDDVTAALPDAPQLGTTDLVEVNDRRALDAVWRDGSLWMVATILPGTGDPDDDQATAFWWRIDTTSLAALTVADQGTLLGEDIATDTSTFFPSIAVNAAGDAVIGFSASAATMYPGAYYATRSPGDAAGTFGSSKVLHAGADYYYRAFGGSRNRWGDYTGATLDPADECFWIYNQWAMSRGTPTSGEDGRWSTTFGKLCLSGQIFSDDFESGDMTAWSSTTP
jgi:hypothetical protein